MATDGLLGHVVRLNVAVDRVLAEITGASGISVADYLVLGVVRRAPQHRSAPTAICELLGRTTGGMTLTIDRLVKRGLVRRLPDPSRAREECQRRAARLGTIARGERVADPGDRGRARRAHRADRRLRRRPTNMIDRIQARR